MANLTGTERHLVVEFAQARRANMNGPDSIPGQAQAFADRLRMKLPELDDVTLAKVVLAIGMELIVPGEPCNRMAGIAVTVIYAGSVLGESDLADPAEA